MILLRLIILGLILWIAYRLLRKYLASPRQDAKPSAGEFQPMVTCEHCGLHLPREEALVRNKGYFCCETHARANDESE